MAGRAVERAIMREKLLTILFILPLIYSSVVQAGDIMPVRRLYDLSITDGKPLKQPSGAVVGKGGRTYVLDGVNNRVAVFSPAGKFLFDFGKGGDEDGELNFPLGINADWRGRVYVADSGNHRVQVFNSEGDYLYKIALPSNGLPKPSDPTDVAIGSDRNTLYIVDNDNHRIFVYNLSERKMTNSIGGMEVKEKGFRWPFSIALDKEGYQYVVDVINATVRVLSPDGRFTIDIGKWGVDKGQLYRPKGVALDSKGRVYISDSFLGVVQVFDRDGNFVSAIGGEDGRVRKFITPARLYIDKEDRLFVTEMFANRVSVYKLY